MPVRTKSLHKLDSSFTNADESKRRKASRSRETTQDSTPTCWTAGEIFADGTVLELIRVESEELQLLVWNDTVSCVEPQVKLHGVTYRPIALPVDLGNAILLPTACAEPSISGKALIDAMSKTLTSLISADPEALRLLAFQALATWFVECYQVAPTLTVFGPTAEVADLLRILLCFCRRGVLVNSFRPKGLERFPLDLQPTLLILEGDLWIERAGSCFQRRDFFHSTKRGLDQLSCCTVVHASEASPPDPESLQITIPPARGCSAISPSLLDQLAAEFQPKLLSYRLSRLKDIGNSTPDLNEFTRGVAEKTAGLIAAVDDDELRNEIREIMQAHNEQLVANRASTPQNIVIEAVLACCHAPELPKDVYVHEITEIANKIGDARLELLDLSPRQTGELLRALGLRTRRLGGGGRGLRLSEDVRRRVHKLARNYHVRSHPTEDTRCPHCEPRNTIEDID